MLAVIQRVKNAKVEVASEVVGQIRSGILILLSVCKNDDEGQADYLVNKISDLRIFEDQEGKMNLSALETKAEILVVSQFTLHGSCEKGRRPSFDKAADPQKAERLYGYFVDAMKKKDLKVETGKFKAMMDVALINDGPVTLIVESPIERDN